MTTLRDIIGMAPDPSVRDFVEGKIPSTACDDDDDFVMVSAMPGDDVSQHPFIQAVKANPYWGRNPAEVYREVQAGTIPNQVGRGQAMAWLKACEACGERIFARR